MRHSPEITWGGPPGPRPTPSSAWVGVGDQRDQGVARGRGRPPHNGTFITFGGPAGPWGTPLTVTWGGPPVPRPEALPAWVGVRDQRDQGVARGRGHPPHNGTFITFGGPQGH